MPSKLKPSKKRVKEYEIGSGNLEPYIRGQRDIIKPIIPMEEVTFKKFAPIKNTKR